MCTLVEFYNKFGCGHSEKGARPSELKFCVIANRRLPPAVCLQVSVVPFENLDTLYEICAWCERSGRYVRDGHRKWRLIR